MLILKSKHPSKVSEFRLIACCKAFYKIIFEVIPNRLKKVLYGITSLTLSSFIPGNHMGDNILFAYEIVKHYNREHISPRLVLKVDLRKAYDSVEWCFILHVMLELAFLNPFAEWIK